MQQPFSIDSRFLHEQKIHIIMIFRHLNAFHVFFSYLFFFSSLSLSISFCLANAIPRLFLLCIYLFIFFIKTNSQCMIIYSKRIEMTEIQSHESNNKSHEIDYLADIAVLSKFFFPSHIQYDDNKFYDWSKKNPWKTVQFSAISNKNAGKFDWSPSFLSMLKWFYFIFKCIVWILITRHRIALNVKMAAITNKTNWLQCTYTTYIRWIFWYRIYRHKCFAIYLNSVSKMFNNYLLNSIWISVFKLVQYWI